MALRYRFNLPPPKPREPLKAEGEIAALQVSAERRLMALGKRYNDLTLNEKLLAEVEEDLRRARMYEVVTMASTMRAAELDEQRRRILAREAAEEEERRQQTLQVQLLRQRALAALQREAEASKVDAERRLQEDRRQYLEREKVLLLQRRKKFETEQSDQHALSNAPPMLVMNVSLGNGKEDRIVVRENDDPKRIAVAFARRHKLPEHSVTNLAAQIRANLATAASQKSAAASSGGITPPSSQRIPASQSRLT